MTSSEWGHVVQGIEFETGPTTDGVCGEVDGSGVFSAESPDPSSNSSWNKLEKNDGKNLSFGAYPEKNSARNSLQAPKCTDYTVDLRTLSGMPAFWVLLLGLYGRLCQFGLEIELRL
jgi:hypothetical protein